MRTVLFILLAFAALGSSAQSASQKAYCIQGTCKQTINQGDTATLVAQMTTSDLTIGSFIWKQTAGPGIGLTPISGGVGGTSQSYIGVRPASNGTYVFSITGTSAGGITATVSDTLVVNVVAKRIAYITVTYTDSSRVKTQ